MSGSPKYADVTLSASMQAQLDELIGRGTSGLNEILEDMQSTGLAGRGSSLVRRGGGIASSATRLIRLAEQHGFRDAGQRVRGIVGKVRRPGLPGSSRASLAEDQAARALRREASQLRQRIEEEQRRKLILETVAQAASDLGYTPRMSKSPDGPTRLELTGRTGSIQGSVREDGANDPELIWEIDGIDAVEEVVEGRTVRSCPSTEQDLSAIHERARELGVHVGTLEWEGKLTTSSREKSRGRRESQRRAPRDSG